MPASAKTVDRYLAFLKFKGLGPSSANMALAAVGCFHRQKNLDNPASHQSVLVSLAGMKRLATQVSQQAQPMNKSILRSLMHHHLGAFFSRHRCDPPPLSVWRGLWFEMIAFSTLSRFSDVRRLTRRDVTVRKESISLTFVTRKNDQNHNGHFVTLVASKGWFCPVKFTKAYLARIPLHLDTFLLPDLRMPTPTSPAQYNGIRASQKRLLKAIGVDPTPFGLHSGRVGGSVALHDKGWKWDDIGAFGGWSPKSVMPFKYCQRATTQKSLMFHDLLL